MAFVRTTAFILISCILFTHFLSAQKTMTSYDILWKKVDSLYSKKGLTQSALTEVNKIYTLAKKENQDAQLVKALLYQVNLQQTTEEQSGNKSIDKWQQEITSAAEPSKSILQSILAEHYHNYYQQHRWQLYDRTQTMNFKKEDMATWSAIDFVEKITALYLVSVKNEKILQQTKLEPFDAIITKGNVRYLRPTLYDLLAHRALDYFKNEERDITKPAYAFEIKDNDYFAPAVPFSKLAITSQDPAAVHHKALLVFQQLLAMHANDPKPDALIDADIARLQFVQQFGVMENKEKLYEQALTVITDTYKTAPAAAQAFYLLAQLHANKAAQYDPLKDDEKDPGTPQGEYIIAAKICRQVLEQKEASEGRVNCYNLLQQIERKELNLATEKVNLPQQPFRTLVSYRNFTKLYFRLALLNDDLKKKLENRYDNNYWNNIVALKPLRSWDQSLPATNDYQKHHAEIKVDALPVGEYILLASTNPDFSFDRNPLAVQYFYISGISYISNANEYFMLDRQTGKPLEGAIVQTWWNQYDYNTRANKRVKGEKVNADKNGYVRLAKNISNRQGNLQLEITNREDRLFMNDAQYIYYREDGAGTDAVIAAQYEKDNARMFFFTDRSIYRPGQTIYFKGIAVTNNFTTRKSKVYSDIKSIFFLRNANGENIDSIELTTNEYGSCTGKFILPQGILNGEFTLINEVIDGNTSFAVEEYKRPKFFVDYDKVTATYKVNDSITITGFAKAYAGNNIDGAQVKYRVQRVARFIYPWLYWKRGYPRASNMEITNGILTTGADGKFNITFKAIPDLSINKDLEPIFDYTVTADITDINGETRSGQTIVPVAYKALQLSIGLNDGENIIADSLKTISLSTKNIAGVTAPALVTVSISRLQAPDRLIRKRYWQQPDQFIMSKEEFIKNFPNDEYQNENNYQSWPKEKSLFTKTDSSNTPFLIPITIPEGWYAIEAVTKDKYGSTVKDIKYIQLYSEKSKTLGATAYTWSSQKNNTVEPGAQSTIIIGSSATDIFLVQQIDKPDAQTINPKNTGELTSTPAYNFINLNGKQSFNFPVTDADRGGFGVTHFFVRNNRFYIVTNQVNVPWTNKELQISYTSFRDKTLPGSEEKWKLKISGYKKEKLAAEMLASMYDASLDQFKPHSWAIPGIWPTYYGNNNWMGNYSFNQVQSQEKYWTQDYKSVDKAYDYLNTMSRGGINLRYTAGNLKIRGSASRGEAKDLAVDAAPGAAPMAEMSMAAPARMLKAGRVDNEEDKPEQGYLQEVKIGTAVPPAAATGQIQIRKNFNETAFFFPDLKTDTAGNIEFGFTIPEALTKWTFQALAHTKELAFGYSVNNTITQKQLMVQPNAPRFLREGDKMELSTKVVNLTDSELMGTVQLELFNAASNQPVDGWFHNISPTQYFTAAAAQSTVVKFSIDVPYQYNSALSYRFVAKAGAHSDGEEAAMPVLSNSMLVTESMPLPMRGNAAKNFRFEKLLQSGNSETLQQHALTVEFTTNPAWYAVQALPYLMEYPYDCAEQTFNRYYANALATKIANTSPRLKEIFEKWKTSDTAALLSNLQKNPELKAALLEETPWVMEAKNETQQKKNIALLFDMLRMSRELSASFEKLKQLQSSNGGFVWFEGGPDDRYMTQYILTGIGHLAKLGALNAAQQKEWATITKTAVGYLDQRMKEDYDNLVKSKAVLSNTQLGYLQVQFLYMRSFFNTYTIPGASFTAINYYRKQSQQFWLQQNKYMQGMIALSLSRSGDGKTAGDILKSLKQNAVVNEEMGMYWKENTAGYYWHQAPVETQSLLIEAFGEISKDIKTVNDLKTWLLKQKQTRNWKTTKATAEACYALLLQGSDWLNNTPTVEIKLGDKSISSAATTSEAGTGYFKQTIDGPFVKPAMGEITVKIASPQNQGNNQPAWGAIYWQYFEQLDKITAAATPLKLEKKLFIERNTNKGPVLEPIAENGYIKVGDKIKVRIELRVDRDMEYVHMKDMRASCMEPVNVLSGYKWQGGLGYYESTKDASTNFFFSWLPKGVYVFEYPLFVTHTGNFSNGVTSIQCMYAPEFTSHSEGLRVNAEENK
ncbi:MAG: alpha-2-macroglobulin family protein [Chitinophagaceae bacterium]